MQEPVWITKEMAHAIHSRQLAEHGGGDGVRDEGLLESALARAQNVFLYDNKNAAVAIMAAAYAYGLTSYHPFIDGNKRTALVVSFLFIELNGFTVTSSEEENADVFLKLAAGKISEDELGKWFAQHSVKA